MTVGSIILPSAGLLLSYYISIATISHRGFIIVIITFIPDRIFYNPSTHLSASLTTLRNDFYKITDTAPELLWKTKIKNKQKFENLHSFLWLSKLDRKNSKIITKDIIKSWINIFFNYLNSLFNTYFW